MDQNQQTEAEAEAKASSSKRDPLIDHNRQILHGKCNSQPLFVHYPLLLIKASLLLLLLLLLQSNASIIIIIISIPLLDKLELNSWPANWKSQPI